MNDENMPKKYKEASLICDEFEMNCQSFKIEYFYTSLSPTSFDHFVFTSEEMDEKWISWLDLCLAYWLDHVDNNGGK